MATFSLAAKCPVSAINGSKDMQVVAGLYISLLIEIEERIWIGKKVALTAKAVRIVGIAIIF